MNELLSYVGVGSIGVLLGGLVRHLAGRLLDHRLQKVIEGYKHTLGVLAKRLDFLHQERGKASLNLVRLLKLAKMHVKLLVDPMQLGPVDQESAWKGAHTACTDVHNLIAETSFLFPKRVEDQMLKTRSALWGVLNEASVLLAESKRKNTNPFADPEFRQLWKKLRAEFEPLETALIAEIRSLLGATLE